MSAMCPEDIITKNERGEIVVRSCGRQLLERSDRCLFHDPHAWRTQAELMRKEIREKIEKGDLNFQKYHLPGIDFLVIAGEFRGPADFSEAVFHGNVHFSYVTFFSSVDFSGAKFLRDALFNGAKFLGDTAFVDAKFSEEAAFVFAEFSKAARFIAAEFSGYAWFSYAEFLGVTEFEDAKFSKTAWFIYDKFLENASFDHAEFLGVTHFENVKFSEERKVRFDFSRFHEIVGFDGIAISDVRLTFRNTVFERGLSIYEYLWSESGFRLKIEESDLALAADSYQALRRGFENMGHYTIAGELFYHEMTCRKNMIRLSETITHSDSIRLPRKFRSLIQAVMRITSLRPIFNKMALLLKVRVRWNKLINWLWTRLFDVSCGFGERPKRVLLGCILTVFVFTTFYFPIVASTHIWGRLQTAFLLSLDAFTPGKFLNIPFTSPGEWLVQIETVLGWFMLSLFLVVFTRKMSRG